MGFLGRFFQLRESFTALDVRLQNQQKQVYWGYWESGIDGCLNCVDVC